VLPMLVGDHAGARSSAKSRKFLPFMGRFRASTGLRNRAGNLRGARPSRGPAAPRLTVRVGHETGRRGRRDRQLERGSDRSRLNRSFHVGEAVEMARLIS